MLPIHHVLAFFINLMKWRFFRFLKIYLKVDFDELIYAVCFFLPFFYRSSTASLIAFRISLPMRTRSPDSS